MSQSTPASNRFVDKPVLVARHPGILTAAVMAVSICQFLDSTIANVALPHIRNSLGAGMDEASWILTSFIIAGAIITPMTGWLSDKFGSRNLFMAATAGFLGTSALCGMAQSLPQIVLFRGLQGVAAALMGPMSQTIMYDINPPSKQARAMAIWGMVVIVAPISGPFIGGYLTDVLNWRWVFYVNLPFGLPALAVIWWLLPSRPLENRPLDLFGFSMLGFALASLQLVLDRGQQNDWFESWETIIEMSLAAGCFWVFLIHSRFTKIPLFHSALFKDRNFFAAMILMAALGIANVGLAALLPSMYQSVYGYSVMNTGLLMAPRGVGVMVTMWITNRLVNRMDYRFLSILGFVIVAYAMWTMSRWSLDQSYETIVVSSFIQGLGLGFTFVPMSLIGFAQLPVEYRMEGSALLALARNLGGSFGISVIVTMLARNTQVSHADLAGKVTSFSIPAVDVSALADQFGSFGAAGMGMIDNMVNQQALMIAYLDNFYLMFWVLLAIAPLPLIVKKPPRIVPDDHHTLAME
jgi:DHA2 family multidrug resistance protein